MSQNNFTGTVNAERMQVGDENTLIDNRQKNFKLNSRQINERYPVTVRKKIEQNITTDDLDFLSVKHKEHNNIVRYYVEDTPFKFTIGIITGVNSQFQTCPVDSTNYADSKQLMVNTEQLSDHFIKWLNIVREQVKYVSPLDEVNLREQYRNGFFTENNFNPFDEKYNAPVKEEVVPLVTYLLKGLSKEINESPEAKKPEIKRLLSEIAETVENVSTHSEGSLFIKFCDIYATLKIHAPKIFLKLVEHGIYSHTLHVITAMVPSFSSIPVVDLFTVGMSLLPSKK
jgi:hypothetical protein